MHSLKKLALGISLLATGAAANAATLSLIPSDTSIILNDSVSLDVVISGIGSTSVGGFQLDLDFNDAVVSLDNYSFSSYLGAPSSIFDASNPVDSDTFTLAVTSLLPPGGFNQPDSFSLATLNFTGIGLGESLFSAGNILVSDDFALYEIDITSVSGASVEVNPVPVPAAFWMLGSGLFALYGIRRKSNKTA